VSGSSVTFIGEAMTGIVQAILAVREETGSAPVVVGGLAVMCRLQRPYRATVDLDVVDRRLRDQVPHLELLRLINDAEPVDPAAVLIPTPSGMVKIDVLEVNQAEIDNPSDDVGDRLFATSHAWAWDSATPVSIQVMSLARDPLVVASALVAEPGPIVAMKLQAVMNRADEKKGTDLLDIVRVALDPASGPTALRQIKSCAPPIAADIAEHVEGWFSQKRGETSRLIAAITADDVNDDDLDLVHELLMASCSR
jgi:hypothetical protein